MVPTAGFCPGASGKEVRLMHHPEARLVHHHFILARPQAENPPPLCAHFCSWKTVR